MLQLLLVLCTSLLLQPSDPASPPAPAAAAPSSLSRFSPEAQSQITAAAKTFRVHIETGRWYDATVLLRHLRLRDKPTSDKREVAAHGADGSIVYKTVPLLYDPLRDKQICDPEDVSKLFTFAADGYERCDMVLVADRIISPSLAIARPHISVHFGGDLDWSPEPDPVATITDHHVAFSQRVAIRNHTFRVDGDRMSLKFYREAAPTQHGAQTLRTFETCSPEEIKPTMREPTPEELATAIINKHARLTEWSWSRKQATPLERGSRDFDGKFTRPAFKWIWTPKDVTPIPGEP